IHGSPNAGRVRKIKRDLHKSITVGLVQVVERAITPGGAYNTVAASQQMLSHQAAEARRDSGNEPGFDHESISLSCCFNVAISITSTISAINWLLLDDLVSIIHE